mgnify:CR=1 FL=1
MKLIKNLVQHTLNFVEIILVIATHHIFGRHLLPNLVNLVAHLPQGVPQFFSHPTHDRQDGAKGDVNDELGVHDYSMSGVNALIVPDVSPDGPALRILSNSDLSLAGKV